MSTPSPSLTDFAVLLRFNPSTPEDKLFKAVQYRLSAIGAGKVCSRCGGCGHYSFNGSHSICYGCQGAGKVIRKLDGKAYDEGMAQVAAGQLDEYLEFKRASANMAKYRDEISYSTISGYSFKQTWEAAPTEWNAKATRLAANDWNAFLSREWSKIAEAAKLANAAQVKVSARNGSLSERKEALAAFLPLWADFIAKRTTFYATGLARADFDFHYTSGYEMAQGMANGEHFACVNWFAQWESKGRPKSVEFERAKV